MGTNYYHEPVPCPHPCAHCNMDGESLHIGKSSVGWCFSLHVIPEEGIHNLEDWKRRFAKGGRIVNEYGDKVSSVDMVTIITNRSGCWGQRTDHSAESRFHEANGSMRGPRGLLRHKLDDRCIAHGTGTWDCITGSFS